MDISWALSERSSPRTPAGLVGSKPFPRKAVDISWALPPQPARALRKLASPRGVEADPVEIQRDERERMASQRALAEEAAAAAAAKTLAQAEEVSRRRDEMVERLAQEIRDLKEKLAKVGQGAQPVDPTAFGAPAVATPNGFGDFAQSWALPKEGGPASRDGGAAFGDSNWGPTMSQPGSRQSSKGTPKDDGSKRRKDKDRSSRRLSTASSGGGGWPDGQAASFADGWSKQRTRSSSGELPVNQWGAGAAEMSPAFQKSGSWDRGPALQRSGSGDMRQTPTMQRSGSGEMRQTPSLQRSGSGDMHQTPTLRRSGSGDVRQTAMQRSGSGDSRQTPTMQRSGSGDMRQTPTMQISGPGDRHAEGMNDEAWAIEEDRLEKYRSVFVRADLDEDGFVEPMEARDVLAKANLPEEDMARIYTLADLDQDGRLSEGEFICALHLAFRRSKEGLMPSELPAPLLALAQRSTDWSVKAEELGHYLQSFQRLDAQSKGIVGQEEGREIFEQSGLPVQELSFIWQLCDRDGDGNLVFPEFAMAMAMVARRRRGWSLPSTLPLALVRSVDSFGPVNWTVAPGELDGYRTIWRSLERSGFADPAAAKDLLEQSQLPVSDLSTIYAMSDFDHDGRLSEPEFLCAMALVARRRQGAALPESVPPELREACWSQHEEVQPQATATWQPNTEELTRFQQLFTQLQDYGYVSAERAREVLESSGLPLDDLAKIWDLADAGDDGKLDLGEFFCAMSLSARRREGHELPDAIPNELLPFLRLRDTEQEMQRYLAIFQKSVPRGATMPSDRAREILEMSELPPSELAQIWRLCGAGDGLDQNQFLCAMALTARRRQGQPLPPVMPPDLFLAAQLV